MHGVGRLAGPPVAPPAKFPLGVKKALREGFTGTVPPPPPPPPVVACTVTAADAALVGSAMLVAITVSVAALVGAVYKPEELMLPIPAVHVTPVLLLPLTVALNWTKPCV